MQPVMLAMQNKPEIYSARAAIISSKDFLQIYMQMQNIRNYMRKGLIILMPRLMLRITSRSCLPLVAGPPVRLDAIVDNLRIEHSQARHVCPSEGNGESSACLIGEVSPR